MECNTFFRVVGRGRKKVGWKGREKMGGEEV